MSVPQPSSSSALSSPASPSQPREPPKRAPERKRGFTNRWTDLYLRHAETKALALLVLQFIFYAAAVFLHFSFATTASSTPWLVCFGACLVASGALQRRVASGLGRAATAEAAFPTEGAGLEDLRGGLAIVTGAEDPVGFETCRALLRRTHVATLILTCPGSHVGADVVRRLRQCGGGGGGPRILFAPLDLADMASIGAFVALLPALVKEDRLVRLTVEALIHAGAARRAPRSVPAEDRAAWVYRRNHAGPAAVTRKLMACVRFAHRRRGGRIVFRASLAQVHAPCDAPRSPSVDDADLSPPSAPAAPQFRGEFDAYATAALHNVLLAERLSRDEASNAFAAHVGQVGPAAPHHPSLLLFKTPREAAATLLHCAAAPLSARGREFRVPNGSAWLVRGGFYADGRLADMSRDPRTVLSATDRCAE